MSDKFDKMSVYDYVWKTEDDDGEEQVFTFKPLPFKMYPKIYKILSELQDLKVEDDSDGKEFLKVMTNKNLIEELLVLEKEMVLTSYPDLSEEKVERFVSSNVFELMTPLIALMSKAEKVDKRRTDKAKNELSAKD